MNHIQELIKRKIIEPEKMNQAKTVIGEIDYYDAKNNRADVKVPNLVTVQKGGIAKGKTYILLKHVPVGFSTGMYNAGPFKGDKVFVSFQNNDIKQPIITGHVDTTYMHTTRRNRTEHGMKGGFLPSYGIVKKDNFREKEYPTWMKRSRYGEDWSRNLNYYSKELKGQWKEKTRKIDEIVDSTKKKRINKLNRGMLSSVESVMMDAKDDAFKHHAEVGLFHPFHTSGIKLKDNAQIDIFTHPHQGIRLDPDTRSINIHSDWLKLHHDQFRAWVDGQVQWRVTGQYVCEVHGNHETHCDGLYEIHSRKGEVHIESEKRDIRAFAEKNITIRARGQNITIVADSQNVNIKAAQNISIKAGTNISIEAGSHIGLKAPRIDLN
ncbi:MAG: DUF2345 domain-containing protein [Ignavibacterium sp.]|nr:DUF2345 domain-containing protein [Ignavibacterium sp.]